MAHVFVTFFARDALRFVAKSGAKLAIGAAFFCAGCGSDDSESKATEGNRGTIVLSDANNYKTDSSLTIPTVDTASGVDLDICWNDTVKDLQCHDISPLADLDNLSMLRFLHLSTAEIAAKLTAGQLAQSEVDGYLDFHTDHTSSCTKLSALSLFGSEIKIDQEYVESSDRTYMLILSKGIKPGVGARAMTFVKPSEASINTKIDMPSGCGVLEFAADLSSGKTVSVSAKAPWVVDWQDVVLDGQRNPIVDESIDRLLVGFYEGKTVAELEAQIFDIESIATSLWEIPLSGGKKADLSLSRERTSGESFTGFERSDGVWLLGLTCSTCQNPQPVVLSVLDPSAGSP